MICPYCSTALPAPAHKTGKLFGVIGFITCPELEAGEVRPVENNRVEYVDARNDKAPQSDD